MKLNDQNQTKNFFVCFTLQKEYVEGNLSDLQFLHVSYVSDGGNLQWTKDNNSPQQWSPTPENNSLRFVLNGDIYSFHLSYLSLQLQWKQRRKRNWWSSRFPRRCWRERGWRTSRLILSKRPKEMSGERRKTLGKEILESDYLQTTLDGH